MRKLRTAGHLFAILTLLSAGSVWADATDWNGDDRSDLTVVANDPMDWGASVDNETLVKDRKIVPEEKLMSVDYVEAHLSFFSDIPDIELMLRNYHKKVDEAKCTDCTRRKLRKALIKHILGHIVENKDMALLSKMDEKLILTNGKVSKSVKEWKKIIDEQL